MEWAIRSKRRPYHVVLCLPGIQWPPQHQFGRDTAERPHVDRYSEGEAEDDLRRAIPPAQAQDERIQLAAGYYLK